MSDLKRMMRDAAAQPTEHPDVDRAWRRARLHRAGFVAMSLVAVIAVTGGVVIAASNIGESDTRPALPREIEVGGGGAIVFTRFSQDGGIFVMNGDGSEPRRIADGDHYALDFPAWSPDGSKIAFHGFFGEAANEDGGLFVMNADGSGLKLLELAGTSPTWSPDGDEIAFAKGGSLHKISPSGGPSRPVVVRQDVNLGDWSPLGDKFVFSLDGIYVVPESGGYPEYPEKILEGKNAGAYPSRPQWSPDASRIAFTAPGDDPSQNTIDIVNADGSDRRTLTQGSSPTWSPDGTRIAFERIEGEVSHIYSIAIDGSDLQQLTFGPDSDHSPDWGATPADATPEPPDCPAVGEGSYQMTLEPPNPSPGTRVSATGPIPMYGEDGSYSPPSADEAVHFWLDADEKRWEELVEPGLRPDKDPGEGARYLGSQSLADPTLCTFEFAFDMPDVPPGQHSVVPVMFGGGGAAPYDTAVLLIEDRNADESPCDDDRSYGQTIPGRWLEDLILEIGAPGGYEVTKKEVRGTGTALQIDIPAYERRVTLYATMLGQPFPVNEDWEAPREEIGRAGSYTLFHTQGNFAWESYKAINDQWQLSLLAYPGAGNDEVSWPEGTVDWLKEAAAKAEQSPPQCDGPIT